MTQIALVNESTVLAAADFQNIKRALQIQAGRDFFPLWGMGGISIGAVAPSAIPASSWVLAFLDNADQAGALGYHDVTPAGLPLGKAFVKTTLADGGQVSVTGSHELLEMLADPDINLTAEFDDASGAPSKFYAYEVCDACEDDSLGYPIMLENGAQVLVSDFVLPPYFQNLQHPADTRFDYRRLINNPFEILPGGYMGVLDLGNLGAGWQQVTAKAAPLETNLFPLKGSTITINARWRATRRPHIGSRRERRRITRDQWVRSRFPVI